MPAGAGSAPKRLHHREWRYHALRSGNAPRRRHENRVGQLDGPQVGSRSRWGEKYAGGFAVTNRLRDATEGVAAHTCPQPGAWPAGPTDSTDPIREERGE